MKRYHRIGIMGMVFLCSGIHSIAQISIHNLFGRWEIQTVFMNGVEVTQQYLHDEQRWIEFDSNFSLVSDGESYGRKEGSFTLDEDSGLLSFDMDLGFGEWSFWYVDFDDEKMIWTDRGNPNAVGIKIILVHAN
jgi:hypothetical protein